MLSVQCEVLSLVCGSLCVCIYVCVCVSNPVPKGLFHDPTFPCRGMERTCEAPSNEAPHMILGYRQGRLPTYLQSTVAHAVHSFGLFHQPTPASATQPSNQPSPQPIAAQWDPHQAVWQPFSAFPPVVQPGHVHPAKASAPVEPSQLTASPSPLTAPPTVPQSPVSTAPSAPDASHTAVTTEQTSSATRHPPNTPPPSTPAGSVHSDTVNNTQPTDPAPSHHNASASQPQPP